MMSSILSHLAAAWFGGCVGALGLALVSINRENRKARLTPFHGVVLQAVGSLPDGGDAVEVNRQVGRIVGQDKMLVSTLNALHDLVDAKRVVSSAITGSALIRYTLAPR